MTIKKSSIPTILFETRVDIKPLSVNEAWQGRRFKSPKYKLWASEIGIQLPQWKKDLSKAKKLEVHLEFGFSNGASDIDNPIKPILDVLQQKYDFNDKIIYRLIADKVIVPKGKEYVRVIVHVME